MYEQPPKTPKRQRRKRENDTNKINFLAFEKEGGTFENERFGPSRLAERVGRSVKTR